MLFWQRLKMKTSPKQLEFQKHGAFSIESAHGNQRGCRNSDGHTGFVNRLVLRSTTIHLNLLGLKTASLPKRYKCARTRTKQKINKATLQIGQREEARWFICPLCGIINSLSRNSRRHSEASCRLTSSAFFSPPRTTLLHTPCTWVHT